MKLDSLKKRLAALEPEPGQDCPFCIFLNTRLDELPDKLLQDLIDVLDGKCVSSSPELEMLISEIPESSSTCPRCHAEDVIGNESG